MSSCISADKIDQQNSNQWAPFREGRHCSFCGTKYYTATKQNRSISLTIMFHSHACILSVMSKSSQIFVLNIPELNIRCLSEQITVLDITDDSFAKRAYHGRHLINKVQSHKTDQYFISQYIVRGTATFDGFPLNIASIEFHFSAK